MNGSQPIIDLTRWNRTGLDRFRYVDANAATHLEAIRKELHKAFPLWQEMRGPEPQDKDDQARLERLLEQLYSERKDWGYEITRAFSRALHITTEHIDAFANESYLPTATQWESLRRLVAMIGYVPRPQSSAATPLAILAPEDSEPATLPKGTAIKNVPTASIPALIFETDKELFVDPALNGLRLRDWNRNPYEFNPFGSTSDWPLQEDSKVDVGQVAILLTIGDSEAIEAHTVRIDEIDPDLPGASFGLVGSSKLEEHPPRGTTTLVAAPKSILRPVLNSKSTIRFDDPHGLAIGDIVYFRQGTATHVFTEVQNADTYAVTLATTQDWSGPVPESGFEVFRTRRLGKEQREAHDGAWYIAPKPSETTAYMSYRLAADDDLVNPFLIDGTQQEPAGTVRFEETTKLTGDDYKIAEELIISDPDTDKSVGDGRLTDTLDLFLFEGAPPKLGAGDWLMAEGQNNALTAVRIAGIERGDGEFTIRFASKFAPTAYVSFFHAEFQETLRPFEYDINKTPLHAEDLVPDKAPWPAGLVAGRDVIFEHMTDESSWGVAARSTGIKTDTKALETNLKAADYDDFTIGGLVIRANVVIANHGETKPIRILGNGDASQTSQSFVLDVDDVAHVANPAYASGVRADIEVWAGNVRFSQVDELRNSEPTDTHYQARLNEDGHLILTFGDGQHGRRLPTGINNMQIRYRVGGGEIGNVPAYTLSKPAGKSALIDKVRQPIAAAGGGAAEPLEEMRRNAPASVQAMNRAVSLKDYERLANLYAGIWHAVAFEEKRAGRDGDVVVVAVMPAGAEPFLGTLEETLQKSLETRGLPGVPVEVRPYVPARPGLSVSLVVDETRFVDRDVLDAVLLALHTEFQPKNRRPGRPLHRSEIVTVIENVEGVTSSLLVELTEPKDEPSEPAGVAMRRVRRGSEGAIWSLWPQPDCAVFIDEKNRVELSITGETP